MTLAAQQQQFMQQVLADDCPVPPGWRGDGLAEGLSVYRNAYRTRLLEVVLGTFPRTMAWTGEAPLRRAAAHHLIQTPPSSWTIDQAGKGFDCVLADLFAADPEIAELAWLEWAIHEAFVAAHAEALTQEDLVRLSQGFGEADWTGLRLDFLPSLHLRQLHYDVPALYRQLDGECVAPAAAPLLAEPHWCLCWREGFAPTFRLLDHAAGLALQAMLERASFGEVCEELLGLLPEEQAVTKAGEALALWLASGIVTAVEPGD